MPVTADQIKETTAFKSITSNVMQAVIVSKTNRDKISQGTVIAKTSGFDNWVRTTHPTHQIKEIVKELLT